MTTLRPRLFAAAAAALLAVSPVAMSTASAQQVHADAAPTSTAAPAEKCERKGDEIGTRARCAVDALIKSEEALKRSQEQGKALDATLAAKEKNLVCMRKVKELFDAGKIDRETIMKYGKDRACEIVNTLG